MVQDHAVEWDIIGAQRRGAPFFPSPPEAIAGALLFRGVCGVWRTPLVQGMKRWAGDLPSPLPPSPLSLLSSQSIANLRTQRFGVRWNI